MSGLALLLAGLGQVMSAEHVPVPDATLAQQRGGFQLPNGLDIALTVQTQTAVNGAVVLRTVFQAAQGTPTLTVYAPRNGETVASAPAGQQANGSNAASVPVVTYDPRAGIQVMPRAGGPAIALGHGATAATGAQAGLEQIAGGVTDNGVVTQAATGGVRTVELAARDLTITHLAGNAFGSAIANSGSDRTIDTQTSVAIDLGQAGPDVIGSTMLRVGEIAGAAVASRAQ